MDAMAKIVLFLIGKAANELDSCDLGIVAA
jgi:hypothetical protein